MSNDKVQDVLDGGIGFFWVNYGKPKRTNRSPERGYIRLRANLVEVATLNERPLEYSPEVERWPRSITGATEHGGVLLLSFASQSPKLAFGGAQASVQHYRARTLITGPSPDDLRSERLTDVRLMYESINRWSGLSALEERFTSDQHTRLHGYSLELGTQDSMTVQIGKSWELTIAAHWSVSGPTEKRVISTPVAISCKSSRPRVVAEFRSIHGWVQGLLSVCHQGSLVASSGTAHVDTADNPWSRYWDSRFMIRPQSAPQPELRFPFIPLDALGGIAALPRWLRLCRQHPRAVRPVIEPFAGSPRSPYVRMLEVAAAIEYWTNSHRRTRAWARKHNLKPLNLANHVGATFEGWTSDAAAWADEFWTVYNGLKHEPNYSISAEYAGALAESGALLLTAALMDRIAGTKQPSRSIFGDAHHTWPLRERIQEIVKAAKSRPTPGRRRP